MKKPPSTSHDTFLKYHKLLFSFAQGKTGEIEVSKDLVQDTFEKYYSPDRNKIENKKAHFTKILSNDTLNHLHHARWF